MNIEIQNFKSPQMGLAFIYIYKRKYQSTPPHPWVPIVH